MKSEKQQAHCPATGTYQDGDYVEALSDGYQCARTDTWPYLYGAFERPGTYRVTVTKVGYQTWVREGMTVTSDGCHVQPVLGFPRSDGHYLKGG